MPLVSLSVVLFCLLVALCAHTARALYISSIHSFKCIIYNTIHLTECKVNRFILMCNKINVEVRNIYIKRLKDIREDKDLTQKEIAECLKITQQQYSLYESGKRDLPIDLLVELSKYYKLSTDYILGLSNKQ